MKNLSLILNGVLAIAVAILYYLHFSQPKQVTTVKTPEGKDTIVAVEPVVEAEESEVPSSGILYVDIDTINLKYNYIKTQKAAMEKQGAQAEATLKAKAKVLQDEIMAYQKKAQAGELTQQQAQSIEKGLGEKQQALALQEQKLSDQLIEKTNKIQEELNKRMKKELKVYLDQYKADYILGYTEGANILLTNPKLNITSQVLKKLNSSK
jgi:outer membrane protein